MTGFKTIGVVDCRVRRSEFDGHRGLRASVALR